MQYSMYRYYSVKSNPNVSFDFFQFWQFHQFLFYQNGPVWYLFDRKLQFQKLAKLTILASQNVILAILARFARNVEWDILRSFQTLWIRREAEEILHKRIR